MFVQLAASKSHLSYLLILSIKNFMVSWQFLIACWNIHILIDWLAEFEIYPFPDAQPVQVFPFSTGVMCSAFIEE